MSPYHISRLFKRSTGIGSILGASFLARAVASAFPYLIGFGVVALMLIVLTRGRLDYGRIAQEAVSASPRVR